MPTWSHSRLATYEACPLKFYYTYVESPDVEEVLGDNIAAVLGKAVHEALEHLYKEKSFARDVSLESLLSSYGTAWGKLWSDDVVIPEYDARTWENLGRRYLTSYFKRYSPFDQERTIAVERMVRLKLGPYSVVGYVDRIAEKAPGHYRIIDYKTNKFLQPQEKFDSDRQLALYEIGVRRMFKDARKVDLVWEMLHFDKAIESHRTTEQLKQLERDTVKLIERIEDTEDFLPREGPLCEWCSFQAVCPRKRHERATGRMTVREFKKDEGVKVADKFLKARLKAEECGVVLDDARKDVLAYSAQHDVAKLIGSQAAVSVSTMERVSFDPKAEEVLKKAGLWDEFSKLDQAALAKAMDGLDEKIRKKLEKLEKATESKTVRVVKK